MAQLGNYRSILRTTGVEGAKYRTEGDYEDRLLDIYSVGRALALGAKCQSILISQHVVNLSFAHGLLHPPLGSVAPATGRSVAKEVNLKSDMPRC